jgi:[acyl-carrier-protein] S-malonyltransferase
LGTTADANEIKDTAKTQPLLVAAALLAAEQLPMYDAALVAGHSVGELAAAALAGILVPEAAIGLAAARGREMAAACALEPTSMAAVLGGDPTDVVSAIDNAGLYSANRNGGGQIVAAGATDAMDKFTAEPPTGTRVIRMPVAGAFHTPYMAPAEQALAALAGGIVSGEPHKILLSNLDGTAVTTGADMVRRLVRQVTSPVRWDLCLNTVADLGVSAIIELPPAGTLANLAKRSLNNVEIVAVNTPADLAAARDLLARHGVAPSAEPTPHLRVVVSTAAGTFVPATDLHEGIDVQLGQALGHITTRQGPVEVLAHDAGMLVEWLAHHDDPIAPGQPLVRIDPITPHQPTTPIGGQR